jgi:endogenous inhibitor of DNA gyrase (YacG/DUF329 family)
MSRARCPTCKASLERTASAAALPFCSPRCKLLDLGRWLDGGYAIHEPLSDYALPDDPDSLGERGGEA